MQLKVNGLNPYDNVEVMTCKLNQEVSELRFWRNDILLDVQRVKNSYLKGIHF
jgi:dimeric dUTPase (all-alpha-NTP-PPase superfamily)